MNRLDTMDKTTRIRFSAEMENHDNLRAFAFFSANLHKLLPEVPFEDHASFFMEASRYWQLAGDDQRNLNWVDSCGTQGWPEGWHKPGIVATFHTGPYRLPTMWLAKQGVPLTLVVSADVARKQHDSYRTSYERIAGSPQAGGYEYLVAEDPMILRKMVRAVQRGRFLLVYVDGHTGVGKNPHGRGTLTMDFLAHQLRVKTGVAELARLARVPIYPVLARFDRQDQPVIERFEMLALDGTAHGAIGVGEGMAILYRHLATFVRQYPMQWEGWFHVHHDLVRPKGSAGGLFRHYLPFKLANRCFLLDKGSFRAYPLSEQVYQKLKKSV